MITLRKLVLQRGDKRLLDGVDLTIFARQKIGITGANGSGKSSLIALLRGELHADGGDVELQPGTRIAHVAQETPSSTRSAIDYALDGDGELRRIEAALREAEARSDNDALARLHADYEQIDGYSAQARAAQILDGLGFSPADLQRPVAEFSGGWRMRLNLAQALLCPSDLLMLDEPTNHLDLDAVFWLEDWLRHYPGTVLLISHDREFLDAIVDGICHLEARALRLYKGSYTDFERQRVAHLASQQAAYDKQQREIAHLRSFVERFRAKATKARQAQSRLKALDRMDVIAAVHASTPFTFTFRAPQPASSLLLNCVDTVAGYGGQPIVQGIRLAIVVGARIGLLGANGAGKSTLIKMLAGDLPILGGERTEGKGLAVGYFAQHQLDKLRTDESPLQHMLRLDPQAREQDLRDFLGGFDFRGNVADAPVGRFSGGERARLTLALLIWQRPNLLLLDEPTNHLDLEMREALTLALQDYEGAMVLVSHDRHLLRATTDDLLLVDAGAVREFDGDLDDYRAWLAQRRRELAASAAGETEDTTAANAGQSRREQRRQEAQAREKAAAQRKPLETQLRRVEAELNTLAQEKARLETLLADPNLYGAENRDTLKQALQEQSALSAKVQDAEERWLTLQGALEQL